MTEFPEKVYSAMVELLSNRVLGLQPLQYELGYYENYTKTIISCLSTTADEWYSRWSEPKDIYYAIVINTVDEYLESSGLVADNSDFWNALYINICEEKNIIEEKLKNIVPGITINIDDYHKEIMERLNANTQ